MKKKLLITFDYELYLGNRSGEVDDCMIEPTNKLIEIMKKFNLRSIFFVDTTYLLQLKEKSSQFEKCRDDFQKVSKQLLNLIQSGHYVYPHIHPHWLDAVYNPDTNQWSLNNIQRYRFHNVNETDRVRIFTDSVNCLNEIILPHYPDYKISGFRAGGWCIQPFADFKSLFIENKIKFDFSVLSGVYQYTDAQHFDFTRAPSKPIYKFENDVAEENNSGAFYEFNISTIKISTALSFFNKIWLKFYTKISGDNTYKKGEGQRSNLVGGLKPLNKKGIDLGNIKIERIAIELMSIIKLKTYLNYLATNDYMHFISHPKMITRHNLKMFKNFLSRAYNKYEIESDHLNMIPE